MKLSKNKERSHKEENIELLKENKLEKLKEDKCIRDTIYWVLFKLKTES